MIVASFTTEQGSQSSVKRTVQDPAGVPAGMMTPGSHALNGAFVLNWKVAGHPTNCHVHVQLVVSPATSSAITPPWSPTHA